MTPSRDPKKRPIKARPAFVVRPLFVSQETAFAVLGITPRRFREWLVPLCRDSVVRMGKTALIPADVAEEKLRGLAVDAGGDATDDPDLVRNDPRQDELQTVDAILHALGRRRAT